MRTWRVGTISMGITLILLGVFLILSQLFNWEPAYTMMSWWPFILIVLGIEVLVYLFSAKQENPVVKYDLFSIFFVGVIGVIGIGFAAVSATGILDKVYHWTNIEVKTLDLPSYSHKLDDSVNRVVVNIGPESLAIETGETSEVAIFGTYTADVGTDEIPIKASEDYLLTEQKGDTLFVTFKSSPEKFTPFDFHIDRNATMMIPNDVQVEIDANHQSLYVNSRTLQNDWTIMNAVDVNMMLADNLDVMLNAENIGHIDNEDSSWLITKDQTDDEWHERHSGTLELGKGTYMMNILNTSNVSVIKK